MNPKLRSPLFATLAASAAVTISAAVACTATTDPRAGVGGPNGSSGSSGQPPSSSGGNGIVDADVPDAPLDCGPAPSTTGAFTKQALLGAAADCAAWHACGFQNAASVLKASTDAYEAAPPEQIEQARGAAQAAWKGAMEAWSKLELFQFGPVGSKVIDKYHGRGLRSWIHPWPDTNRCQVETQVAGKGYQTDGFQFVVPGGRGLFALEYLLFYPGSDISCLPNATATQAWATFTPEALAAAKNDYAVAVSDNILALALEVSNVWSPSGENFKAKLQAFEGYGSEQETLNVVAWSLMYPEKEVKDWKLGGRAGIQATAPSSESPFAGVEVSNMRTNLRAFRSLFQGCGEGGAGIGFDDWLISAQNPQLAADMLAALDRAQAAADAFPEFSTATEAQFVAMYGEIKPLSDLLKNSFFGSASPLNLKLPASAASDTD